MYDEYVRVYVYVCVYARMCVYVCVHTQSCMHLFVHARVVSCHYGTILICHIQITYAI